MNESEFENSLRALRPAPASRELAARIAAELRGATATAGTLPRGQKSVWSWLPLRLGAALAAIALALFVIWKNAPPIAPAPAPALAISGSAEPAPVLDSEPEIESTRELIDASEEGLVYEDDGEPARRIRFRFIERHSWTDPATGALVDVEIPSEDVLLMPVVMQ